MMQRVDRLLASTGRWSRTQAKDVIRAGRVQINGESIRDPAAKTDADTAVILIDGAPLDWRRFTWIMLNKPAGYLSATQDGRGPTVMDLLTPELRRQGVFPVGRLDKDSEGLLLLTNDGLSAHRLLSPKNHVDKVYFIRVSGRLNDADAAALASGTLALDGKPCLPARLEILSTGIHGENDPAPADMPLPDLRTYSEALRTLREGKYHQAKRMLAKLGKPVRYLERVKMGNLPLDLSLKRGSFRFLTDSERETLLSCAAVPEKGL